MMEEKEIKQLQERLKTVEQLLCQDFNEKIIRAQRFGYDYRLVLQEYKDLNREKEQIEIALEPYYAKLKLQEEEKERLALERNEGLIREMHKRYNEFSDEYLVERCNAANRIVNNPDFHYSSANENYTIGEITYTRKEIIKEYNILKKHLDDRLAKQSKQICEMKVNLRNEYHLWSDEELETNINFIKQLIDNRRGSERVFFKKIQFKVDELKHELRQIESIYNVRMESVKLKNEIIRQQKEREELQKCIRIELNNSSIIPNDFHAVITDEAKYYELYRRNPDKVRNYINSQIEWEKGREEREKRERIEREEKIKAERAAYFKETEKTKNIGATLKYVRDAYGNIIGIIPVDGK